MLRSRQLPRGLSASIGDGAASTDAVASSSGTPAAIVANMPSMAPRKVSFEEAMASCYDMSSAFLASKWASTTQSVDDATLETSDHSCRQRPRSHSNPESHFEWHSRKRSLHSLSPSKCLSSLATAEPDEGIACESDADSLPCKRMASADWLEEDNWGQFIDVVPAEESEVRGSPRYTFSPSVSPSPTFSPCIFRPRSLRSEPYCKRQRQMRKRERGQTKSMPIPNFHNSSRHSQGNELDPLNLIQGRSLTVEEESLETVSTALYHMHV